MGNDRWPANVILSPGMADVLDQQSGILKSGAWAPDMTQKARTGQVAKGNEKSRARGPREADEGGASRFFLTAGYEQWEIDWILANGLRPHGA